MKLDDTVMVQFFGELIKKADVEKNKQDSK